MRSWGNEVMRSWGHEVMRSWGHEVMRSWGHEVMRTWGHEVMRSWGHEVMRSRIQEVKLSRVLGVKRLWCLKVKRSWNQVIYYYICIFPGFTILWWARSSATQTITLHRLYIYLKKRISIQVVQGILWNFLWWHILQYLLREAAKKSSFF